MTRLLVAAYLVETGLVLIVAPWTAVWQRNVFGIWLPWLGEWMSSAYVQGGVTGIGIVTVLAGLRDLTGAFLTRPGGPPPETGTPDGHQAGS
ncbi:MAG: hypothetical protein R2752_13675 [Vicinamibacterales bacterium]